MSIITNKEWTIDEYMVLVFVQDQAEKQSDKDDEIRVQFIGENMFLSVTCQSSHQLNCKFYRVSNT